MSTAQPTRRRGLFARLRDRRRARRERERIQQQRIDRAIDAAGLRDYRPDLWDRHTGGRP